MKKILVLMASAMIATASFGWVSIGWNVDEGFLSCNDGEIAATADSATTQIIWDLVFTTADSIAAPKLDGGLPSYASTDQWVSRRTWTAGSDQVIVTDNPEVATDQSSTSPLTMNVAYGFLNGTAGIYNNSNLDADTGKFYSAVFQYLSNGDVYYSVTEELVAGKNWTKTELEPDPPKPIPCDFGTNYGDEDGWQINVKMEQPGPTPQVPEPATMGLLGLGALAMVLRRKLRK